jgi:hypothetical protein
MGSVFPADIYGFPGFYLKKLLNKYLSKESLGWISYFYTELEKRITSEVTGEEDLGFLR